MRKFNVRAFNDFVHGTTTVYTSSEFDALLGSADRLALCAVLDSFSGGTPAHLFVQIQHSGDGRNWENLNTVFPEIDDVVLGSNQTIVSYGYDNTAIPTQSFVRLAIWMTENGASAPNAHIEVWACGRDEEKDDPQVGAARPNAAVTGAPTPPAVAVAGASPAAARATAGQGQGCGCGAGSTPGATGASSEGCSSSSGGLKPCVCAGKEKSGPPGQPMLRVVQGKGLLELWGMESTGPAIRSRISVGGALSLEIGHTRVGDGLTKYVHFGSAFLGAGNDLDIEISNGIVSGTMNGRPIIPSPESAPSLAFFDGGPPPSWDQVLGAAEQARALFEEAGRQIGAPNALPLDPALTLHEIGCPKRILCFGEYVQCTLPLLQQCPSNDSFCLFFQSIIKLICDEVFQNCIGTSPIAGESCSSGPCCDGSACPAGTCCWGLQHACTSSSECCGGAQCPNKVCCKIPGQPCTAQADCCLGADHDAVPCDANSNTCCRPNEQPCVDNSYCCSGNCRGGTCVPAGSCIPFDGQCQGNADCCPNLVCDNKKCTCIGIDQPCIKGGVPCCLDSKNNPVGCNFNAQDNTTICIGSP
jgi:hypothetical protein